MAGYRLLGRLLNGEPKDQARKSVLGRKHRLVLVDDDVLMHELVERRLRDVECDCTFFGEALAGLAYLQSTQPDTLIVDQKMPRLDGLDLLDQLGEARPNRVFIASSVDLTKAAEEAARSHNATFISKDRLIEKNYLSGLLGLV